MLGQQGSDLGFEKASALFPLAGCQQIGSVRPGSCLEILPYLLCRQSAPVNRQQMIATLPWPVVGELVTEGQAVVAIPALEVAGDVFFSHLLGIKIKTGLARRFTRIGQVS